MGVFVHEKVGRLRKGFEAYVALVRTFAGVNPLVGFHLVGSQEGLGAVGTAEFLFAVVRFHVRPQVFLVFHLGVAY